MHICFALKYFRFIHMSFSLLKIRNITSGYDGSEIIYFQELETLRSHQKIEMEWDRKKSSWDLLEAGEKLCLMFVLHECGKTGCKDKPFILKVSVWVD